MDDLFLLGRMIFGGFFLYNGANHFLSNVMFVQYAASKGTPMPELAVAGAGLLLLVGGFCVLTGLRPNIGLFAICLFLVGVTPVMHNFWALTDPAMRMQELGHFMTNVALLGATLMMAVIPQPWPYSLKSGHRVRA